MRLEHAQHPTSGLIIVCAFLSTVTISCANNTAIENQRAIPGTSSKVSSITVPVPSQLQPYLGADKINSLSLRITPQNCEPGIQGNRIEKFIGNFGQNSFMLNERLTNGCTYTIAISLGQSNARLDGFTRIFLTNDTEKLWSVVTIPKANKNKLTVSLRVYPTNDGKQALELPGTPIELEGINKPDGSPQGSNLPNDLEPNNQNQQQQALNWNVVLMASDQANEGNWISAFDNARTELHNFFSDRGVAYENMRQLSLKPQHQNQMVLPATTQTLTSTISSLAVSAKANDACLIHMTSHGSRDGFNIGSSRLSPQALGAALDAGCGERPTVLLISACYSGLYTLDSSNLKKPNRVILTAARHDRTSFGCSPENEFTYWDGCLVDHLPTSGTFKNLANNLQSCIATKETGMPTPSLPQAFIGSEVESLMIP
jgi:hypothetical protein